MSMGQLLERNVRTMITRLHPSRLFPFLGLAAAIAAGVLASASVATAQTSFAVLESFNCARGCNPQSRLIQAPDGTLYGTTDSGGLCGNCGTIFRLPLDGSGRAVLHFFSGGTDGAGPHGGLIQASDGTLYGTTANGGGPSDGGTIFQMAPDGSGYTILHSFTDGVFPFAGLIQAPDGTLYGTTFGGLPGDRGTVFQMAPDGSGFTVLHRFGAGTDGALPRAGLIQAPDGTLYGTTANGGPSDGGTIFQMAPDGSGYAVLHSFTAGTDGAGPFADLIQAPDGTLYGTTLFGGDGCLGLGCGTVFGMAPDGSGFAVLHRFTAGTDGAAPFAGLIQPPTAPSTGLPLTATSAPARFSGWPPTAAASPSCTASLVERTEPGPGPA
jgi:uncharacterized repeat protein (TIGR03803 family)